MKRAWLFMCLLLPGYAAAAAVNPDGMIDYGADSREEAKARWLAAQAKHYDPGYRLKHPFENPDQYLYDSFLGRGQRKPDN